MRIVRAAAAMVAVAFLAGGCAGTSEPEPMPTPTTTDTGPECDADEALAVVEASIGLARLRTGEAWSPVTDDNPFAERTATGEEFADRLALDCGLRAQQSTGGADRLVLTAWTGTRVAYVVQATDAPATPYREDSTVDLLLEAPQGEFVDGDSRAVWAGTLERGETVVVGHVDYSLGATAKGWQVGPRDPGDESPTLDSERHGLAALAEAGMRNVRIAQPPELGSEEGYVSFVSPAGQILAADVAPTGWFDPMTPRFFTGDTSVLTVAGVQVRRTEPLPDDNLGFTRGAEFGWSCAQFDWILEPPLNGDGDEMLASVEAVVANAECGASSSG